MLFKFVKLFINKFIKIKLVKFVIMGNVINTPYDRIMNELKLQKKELEQERDIIKTNIKNREDYRTNFENNKNNDELEKKNIKDINFITDAKYASMFKVNSYVKNDLHTKNKIVHYLRNKEPLDIENLFIYYASIVQRPGILCGKIKIDSFNDLYNNKNKYNFLYNIKIITNKEIDKNNVKFYISNRNEEYQVEIPYNVKRIDENNNEIDLLLFKKECPLIISVLHYGMLYCEGLFDHEYTITCDAVICDHKEFGRLNDLNTMFIKKIENQYKHIDENQYKDFDENQNKHIDENQYKHIDFYTMYYHLGYLYIYKNFSNFVEEDIKFIYENGINLESVFNFCGIFLEDP